MLVGDFIATHLVELGAYVVNGGIVVSGGERSYNRGALTLCLV